MKSNRISLLLATLAACTPGPDPADEHVPQARATPPAAPAPATVLGPEIPEALRGFCRAPGNAGAGGGAGERVRVWSRADDAVVYHGDGSFEAAMRCVITGKAQWDAFVAAGLQSQAAVLPPASFGDSVLVAATWGMQSSTGYVLDVTAVDRAGGGHVAEVRLRSPGAGCDVGPLMTSPVDVVRVPRDAVRDLIFTDRDLPGEPCG